MSVVFGSDPTVKPRKTSQCAPLLNTVNSLMFRTFAATGRNSPQNGFDAKEKGSLIQQWSRSKPRRISTTWPSICVVGQCVPRRVFAGRLIYGQPESVREVKIIRLHQSNPPVACCAPVYAQAKTLGRKAPAGFLICHTRSHVVDLGRPCEGAKPSSKVSPGFNSPAGGPKGDARTAPFTLGLWNTLPVDNSMTRLYSVACELTLAQRPRTAGCGRPSRHRPIAPAGLRQP